MKIHAVTLTGSPEEIRDFLDTYDPALAVARTYSATLPTVDACPAESGEGYGPCILFKGHPANHDWRNRPR